MAEHFRIVSQRETHEVVGGHELLDVWEIGATTIPHNIFYAFRVGIDQHTPEQVAAEAERFALVIEEIRQYEGVTGVAYTQQITPDGRLADEIDVYYQTPDRRHRGVLRFPLHSVQSSTAQAAVDDSCRHLGSIAEL